MAAGSSRPKLIVIVGPTASGKSELAMRIAKRYDSEIIAADSRTIYEGMNIGTAKPTAEDQSQVSHWGLDLIKPNETFSVKKFKDYTKVAIEDIWRRQKLPILVGGTGLYIDAVIFEYDFSSSKESNPANPRHRLYKGGSTTKPETGVYLVGLDPGKEELERRISARADMMFGPAFLIEAEQLLSAYDAKTEAFKAPAYALMPSYLSGQINLAEAKKIFIQYDLKLAKKQRTWFKRNKFILWFSTVEEAEQAIAQALNT